MTSANIIIGLLLVIDFLISLYVIELLLGSRINGKPHPSISRLSKMNTRIYFSALTWTLFHTALIVMVIQFIRE